MTHSAPGTSGGQSDVRRGTHDPRLGAGEEELEVLDAVRCENRQPVTLGEAEVEQRVGEAVRPDVEVGPGAGDPTRHHHRVGVGEGARVAPDDVPHEHAGLLFGWPPERRCDGRRSRPYPFLILNVKRHINRDCGTTHAGSSRTGRVTATLPTGPPPHDGTTAE